MTVELYIRDIGEDYIKAELFKQEEIQLTDSIKDLRQIEKISTTYSQNFNLPASKVNNSVFSHYYNSKVVGGFDARVKVDAIIKVNGADFRKGTLDLRRVKLKNDEPHTYEVIFMGGLPSLKEIFGEKELPVLYNSGVFKAGLPGNGYITNDLFEDIVDPTNWDLERYTNGNLSSITNNLDASTTALEDLDNLRLPDFIVPNISHKAYYWHAEDTSTVMNEEFNPQPLFNLGNNYAEGYYGLNIGDYRPGVKVTKVIEAIAEYGDIQFSDDFFSTNNRVLDDLYLHMNNKNGRLLEDNIPTEVSLLTDDATLRFHPYTSQHYGKTNNAFKATAVQSYEITYKLTKTGGGSFNAIDVFYVTPVVTQTDGGDIEASAVVNNDGLILAGQSSYTATVTINFLPRRGYRGNLDLGLVFEGLADAYDLEIMDIEAISYNGSFVQYASNYSPLGSTTILGSVIGALAPPVRGINWTPLNTLPEIKIIDFLSGLFKMFNLVAYVEEGTYIIKTYDEYINSGDTLDYTNYLDTSMASVMPTELPLDLSFKFKDNNSLLYEETNKQPNHIIANYGDMVINNDNVGNIIEDAEFAARAKGKPKKVELPFTKTLYSQLLDPNDASSDYGFINGWQVDDNYSPVNLKGLLFYATLGIADFKDTSLQEIKVSTFSNQDTIVTHTISSDMIVNGKMLYVRPSNFSTQPTGANHSQSICFNAEADVAHDGELNDKSLFQNFYSHSIGRFYHGQGRLVDVKFRLPAGEILNLGLNDRIVLKGEYYTINKMKYSMTSEMVELNLLRVEPPVNFYPTFGFDTGLPSQPAIGFIAANQSTATILIITASTPFDSQVANQIVNYQIEVTVASTGEKVYPNVTVDTTPSWQLASLDSNTPYNFRIRAVTNDGTHSLWSNYYTRSTTSITITAPTITQGNLVNRTAWDATVTSFNLSSGLTAETVDWFVDGIFHSNLPAGQDLVYSGVNPSQSFAVKCKTKIGNSSGPFSNEITVSSSNNAPSALTIDTQPYVTTDNFIGLNVLNPATDPDGDAITLIRFYEYNTTSPVLALANGDFNAVGEHDVYFPALTDEYDLYCTAVDEYGLEGPASNMFTVDFSAGATDNVPPGFLSSALISNSMASLQIDFTAIDSSGLLSYDAFEIWMNGSLVPNSTMTTGERTTSGIAGYAQSVRVTFNGLEANTGYTFTFKATDSALNQSAYAPNVTYYTAANVPGGQQ